MQDETIRKTIIGNIDPQFITTHLIPKIIKQTYPELSDEELEVVRQHIVADAVLSNAPITQEGDKTFIQLPNRFINIAELSIDLIDSINPFLRAYEILSKQVTPAVLKAIQEGIEGNRIKMDFDEANFLWDKVNLFVQENNGKHPDINSNDVLERRMAQAVIYFRTQKRKSENG